MVLADLHQAPSWDEALADFVDAHRDIDYFVSHNAQHEMKFFAKHLGDRQWICTMKAAMRCWKDAPGFSNGVLRYWKNPLGIDRIVADKGHSAFGDAYTTAFLLRDLLAEHPVETLLKWSSEPAMPPRLNFGRHKGASWDDVDLSYLSWIVDKSDLDEDTKLCAKHHLDRRRAPIARATYVSVAMELIPSSLNLGDLEHWWVSSKPDRLRHGIIEGTPEYTALVDACRQRRDALTT
jgi:exodeoxyribonuclease X